MKVFEWNTIRSYSQNSLEQIPAPHNSNKLQNQDQVKDGLAGGFPKHMG